jgi:hypothetical protein
MPSLPPATPREPEVTHGYKYEKDFAGFPVFGTMGGAGDPPGYAPARRRHVDAFAALVDKFPASV